MHILLNEGDILMLSEDSRAIIYYYQALEISYQLKIKDERINIFNKIAYYFFKEGNLDTSLVYFLNAYNISIEVFENVNNNTGAEACIGISLVYKDMNEFEKSIEFAEKAYNYLQKYSKPNNFKDGSKVSLLLDIFATNYAKLGKIDEQIYYLEESLIKKYALLRFNFSEQEIQEIKSAVSFLPDENKIDKLTKSIEYIDDKWKKKRLY